jgi:mevalonate pyrophosphate decarboxylase
LIFFARKFSLFKKSLRIALKIMENQFLGNQNFNISNQTVTAICPSNIALIKYWGNTPTKFLQILVFLIL